MFACLIDDYHAKNGANNGITRYTPLISLIYTIFDSHDKKGKRGEEQKGRERNIKKITIFFILLFDSFCLSQLVTLQFKY